ncbi:FAD-binding protein [Rhodococcoides kyotonense]|uniref:3-oxosteroid 1-dehydrogenase n=1 Tax=Rhodococcoides kyotonense TaxID=398843 RepID=A0A239M2Z9_9NOCA|nr:FAD-binding protein [Rhodococcus kyotonensis]SNT36493.1 3-oxosteroid 1-dehydrogenase [Rhodococcus kyotonensis]
MTEWDHSVDFLIVGSGGGGLSAAIAAKEAGLQPLVVEKQALVGGSTAMSGGVMWVPNNVLMQEEGVADSMDDSLLYMQSTLGDPDRTNPLARRRAYVTAGNDLVGLMRRRGVEFVRADGYSDYYSELPGGVDRGRSIESQPWNADLLGKDWRDRIMPGMAQHIGLVVKTNELRSIQYFNRSVAAFLVAARVFLRTVVSKIRGRKMLTNGAAIIGQLLRMALDDGIEVWTESPVEQLILDGGRVVGARIVHEGKSISVQGREGVLLAAGGFAHNADMRRKYSGGVNDGSLSIANPGDTGEVLEMGIAAGAGIDLMDNAWWLPSTIAELGASTMGQSRQRPGGILVNREGKRFVNESSAMGDVAVAMYDHDAAPCWAITDDAYRRRYAAGIGLPGHMPKEWFTNGWVKKAETIEDLAKLIDVDGDNLVDTISTFNAHAENGLDPEFGRGVSAYNRALGDPAHKPNPALGPVARGPFYAVQIFPSDAGTGGGLVADEFSRVIGENGSPIAGLYATGNITATVLGRTYFGAGASISYTMAFGYVAARHAASAMEAGRADELKIV